MYIKRGVCSYSDVDRCGYQFLWLLNLLHSCVNREKIYIYTNRTPVLYSVQYNQNQTYYEHYTEWKGPGFVLNSSRGDWKHVTLKKF